jgi:hypothetical protein
MPECGMQRAPVKGFGNCSIFEQEPYVGSPATFGSLVIPTYYTIDIWVDIGVIGCVV